jgi:hypothetical protein
MEIVMVVLEVLRRVLQRAGPYLVVEMLLPGGTLLALTLYLYRRRKILLEPMSIRRPADRL